MKREIKQLIPCTDDLYALYKDEKTGEIYRNKVLAFALCDDGCVYPQVYDRELGIGIVYAGDGASGFELGKSKDSIADALENINSNLYDISTFLERIDRNLDECISRNGNNHFLCVTGNISNY